MSRDSGEPADLHYGLFEPGDTLGQAQQRATQLLRARLPDARARLLDVGCGLGTTLALLHQAGYQAHGLNPDPAQVSMLRQRHPSLTVFGSRLEDFVHDHGYDLIYFQESAQYLAPEALFARSRELAPRLLVIDEFAQHPRDRLPHLAAFLESGRQAGFQLYEEVDLSQQAAPTLDFFHARLSRYRGELLKHLRVSPEDLDRLEQESVRVRRCYQEGSYVYRLLDLRSTTAE